MCRSIVENLERSTSSKVNEKKNAYHVWYSSFLPVISAQYELDTPIRCSFMATRLLYKARTENTAERWHERESLNWSWWKSGRCRWKLLGGCIGSGLKRMSKSRNLSFWSLQILKCAQASQIAQDWSRRDSNLSFVAFSGSNLQCSNHSIKVVLSSSSNSLNWFQGIWKNLYREWRRKLVWSKLR